MNNRKMMSIVLAATMAGALGMSACKPAQDPETPASSQAASQPATVEETNNLLQLNDSLRTELGDAYSDSWIEGAQLHVAVTTESAAATVKAAGATAHLVTLDAAQLETALQAVMTWRSSLPADQGAAIHKVIPDGRTGTVTVFVAPDQLDAVAQAAAASKPAGDVPLLFKESAGLASPL